VVLQSLTYRDCAPEAITGGTEVRANNTNWYSYVHPIIAALFFPKIGLLDEHMLIANMGHIVKCKYEGKPLVTKPDFELYWDLITDPNERVCHHSSSIRDLSNRFLLQTKLWDAVFCLRQGKFYNDRLNDFMLTIDNCKNNIYDAPDFTYVKDEGTMLRRLLSAFSIRPTIVTTSRLYGLLGQQYGNSGALSAAGITEVTTVPMVNLRLPIHISNTRSVAVSLEDALTQPQWYIENKTIVPKSQSIMHSRDVLFFYVGRRFQTVNLTRFNAPYNFNSLPMTIAGWEAVNDRVVNFETTMTLLHDTYELRSVVMVERSRAYRNLIIGSTAAIRIPRNIHDNVYDETTLLYDPQGASEMFLATDGASYKRNQAVTVIPAETPFAPSNVESFYKRASTRGTIFMYQKYSESPQHIDPTGIIGHP
jgi:hypothetical protein